MITNKNCTDMITFFTTADLATLDTLIVPLFEVDNLTDQLKEFPVAVQLALKSAIDRKDISGKKFETHLLYTDHCRIRVVGLGKEEKFDVRCWKHALGVATIAAEKQKTTALGVFVPSSVSSMLSSLVLGEATATAIVTADYAYDEFQSEDARPSHIATCSLLNITDVEGVQSALESGLRIAEAVNVTRLLGNTPPSIMTPALLAERTTAFTELHDAVAVRVLERTDMEELGMGCLLGVSQGSVLPPKFIIAEFMNGGDAQPIVLIGKGITFDSGGLSLKPADYMTDMKFDMLGAGTALGVFHAAVNLDLKKNLVVLIPAAENMPSGSSFRPDDVLTAMNGKTIEIGNTDAEGRLILADALSYAAVHYSPQLVIDFATLTGACMVALGADRSGLFTPHDDIAEALRAAAGVTGEWIWRLPLGEEYTELMKSPVADISNISETRYGGASTAAAFLEFFTLNHETGEPHYPWAHFDLSSAFAGKKGKPWRRYGATGDVVQTVVEFLRGR
jgi:leucyl aminopeptidase